jgi:hypothetical protein
MADFKMDLQTFGIHYRQASGLDMGSVPSVGAALPKLKKFLGIKEQHGLTLMRCTADTLTRTDKNLAPLEYIGSPAVHGYTDQQPIHINSLSSVHEVSTLLPPENQPLNALRFRANIWVTGAPAYQEETWKRYCILPKHHSTQPRANVAPRLSVVCRTSRCPIPNIDPSKGTFDTDNAPANKKKGRPQPSATLVEHRTVENGNRAALGYLGMHCVPEDLSFKEAETQGKGLYVEVGDEIEVFERGVHLYGSTGNDYWEEYIMGNRWDWTTKERMVFSSYGFPCFVGVDLNTKKTETFVNLIVKAKFYEISLASSLWGRIAMDLRFH